MGRESNVRTAKQRIADRRAKAVSDYELHTEEAVRKIPQYGQVMRSLADIMSRVVAESLKPLPVSDKSEQADDANPSPISDRIGELYREYSVLSERKKSLLTENGYPADYCDLIYSCKKCSDTGYVGVDICECLKKELVLASLESSGLFSLVETQSFQTFTLDYYEKDDRILMRQNATRLWEFAKDFVPGKSASFLFLGPTGLGKTHLSSSVAKVVIEKGAYVIYESALDLFGSFEAKRFGTNSYSSDSSDDVNRYTDCDLLIIDDLGCELTNQFTVSCLYNIINSRIVTHRSTIINTNLSQSELRKRYADRVISRIFGEYIPLEFRGRDVREQKLREVK